MADENTELNQGTPQEGSEQVQNNTPQEREYSDVEKEAMAQGWVPEDQFEGHGKWRSAEEFLDRGKLFAKIDEQGRKLRTTETVVNELKAHLKKVRETEYKRALAALKAEKKEALDVGDTERVVEIDEAIADTKQEAARAVEQFDAPPVQESAPNPHFVAWVNRNQWYQNDRVMKAAADAIGDELAMSGERNPTRILEEVEKRIKKEFPQRFTNPNRGKAGAVEGGGSKGSMKGDAFQLTPEETQVMNKLVRHGVMTKEEYIADIKAQRGA
jgi:hypothetical protein